MSEIKKSGYLGLPAFENFSELLETADIMSKAIAGFCSLQSNLTPFQSAVLQNSARTFSLFFSLRLLIESGYLPSAKIVVRSIVDSIGTIAWLRSNPQTGVNIWHNGWQKNARPDFKSKLKCYYEWDVFEENSESLAKILEDDYLDILHDESHGGYQSSLRNSISSYLGYDYLASGPHFKAPDEATAIIKVSNILIMQFMKEVLVALPELEKGVAA